MDKHLACGTLCTEENKLIKVRNMKASEARQILWNADGKNLLVTSHFMHYQPLRSMARQKYYHIKP